MRSKENIWRSIHQDYLQYAVLAIESFDDSQDASPSAYIDRRILDIVRYCYDCLYSSVQFTHHMGACQQLPLRTSAISGDTWHDASLAEKIKLISSSWTGIKFWESEDQFQLFCDFKKLRDGLTHPTVFGTYSESKILEEIHHDDGSTSTRSEILKERTIKPKMIRNLTGRAGFPEMPHQLGTIDAKKAFEIFAFHILRIEELFFRRQTSWFCYFDKTKEPQLRPLRDVLPPLELRQFPEIWK